MVIQFAGYKKCGKTSIISWLTKKLTEKGLKVVVLKHHWHKDPIELKSKDSEQFFEDGAVLSAVESHGNMNMSFKFPDLDIETFVDFIKFMSYDIVLVEGYKSEDYPKFVLLRKNEDDEDLEVLKNLTNIIDYIPYCPDIEEREQHYEQVLAWIKKNR